MHTAHDIKGEFFSIEIEGNPATREELLGWDVRDRLGVVVTEPLGALDAGLLILLTATAFYDASNKRRMRPLYPDIFLFHVGGPWGSHIAFDFAPDHKEIFVAADPTEVLRAINNRGITHLMVPDRPRIPTNHRFKEPEAAIDRIKLCLAYGAGGSVRDADIRVTANPVSALLGSYESALYPNAFLDIMESTQTASEVRATNPDELEIMIAVQRARLREVSAEHPTHQRLAARIAHAKDADTLTDDYRHVDVQAALEMLHSAPR
jgi:hypothetical protein